MTSALPVFGPLPRLRGPAQARRAGQSRVSTGFLVRLDRINVPGVMPGRCPPPPPILRGPPPGAERYRSGSPRKDEVRLHRFCARPDWGGRSISQAADDARNFLWGKGAIGCRGRAVCNQLRGRGNLSGEYRVAQPILRFLRGRGSVPTGLQLGAAGGCVPGGGFQRATNHCLVEVRLRSAGGSHRLFSFRLCRYHTSARER